MARIEVETFKYVEQINKFLQKDGILLVSDGKGKTPNAMTIGWGFLGIIWSRPVFVVAVRHSRHTFKLMESSKYWTVCLPGKEMEVILDVCGTKSGRDMDKFKELKLSAKKGIKIDAPYIEECPVHFECETIFKTDMKPGQLIKEIESEFYKTMDLHMIYFGEVKGCYAVTDAKNKLA